MDITSFLQGVPSPVVYLIAGSVIGVESIGIPLPGESTLITAVLLAVQGHLAVSPWGVAAAAASGAIIGDSIGFYLGNRYGVRLLHALSARFPSHFSLDHIAYAEHVFNKYGMAAVFFGRFIALLRIIAGPLAGALQMDYRRFLVANAAGGICWAFSMTSLVYALGAAADQYLAKFAWAALIVLLLLAFLVGRIFHARIERNVEEFTRRRHLEDVGGVEGVQGVDGLSSGTEVAAEPA